MSKYINYTFEFHDYVIDYEYGATQIIRTPCEITGKYNKICVDNGETFEFEVIYTPKTTYNLVEPTIMQWLRGKRSEWVKTEYQETTKWVDISELHCRAVIPETFSCTTF